MHGSMNVKFTYEFMSASEFTVIRELINILTGYLYTSTNQVILKSIRINVGHAVTQMVEALRYKPEGRGFDSRCCHWNFSLTQSFRPYYGPGVDSASNRNEYQEYFLRVKAAGAYGW